MAAAINVPKETQSVERLTAEREVAGSIPRARTILRVLKSLRNEGTSFTLQTAVQFRFLGNCPPTPPLIQHFALSER